MELQKQFKKKNINQDYSVAAKQSLWSLHCFVKNFWDVLNDEPLVDNFHIKYLCDYLTDQFFAYINDEDYNLDTIVNIPPASSKSTIFSQMFPVWVWIKDPDRKRYKLSTAAI